MEKNFNILDEKIREIASFIKKEGKKERVEDFSELDSYLFRQACLQVSELVELRGIELAKIVVAGSDFSEKELILNILKKIQDVIGGEVKYLTLSSCIVKAIEGIITYF